MKLLQTPTFKRCVKKLHKNQIEILNEQIKKIVLNPEIGNLKKGDLSSVYVYKFMILNQLMLLAYKYENDKIILLAIGSHQNFYEKLKS